MIELVELRRFKQFVNTSIELRQGITLLAGGNNAGKSSILHGLAVWEFCRTATLMERGEDGLLSSQVGRQGFGLGDDEFSPINVPTLNHLWSNLKTQKSVGDLDGYTLKVTCSWTGLDGELKRLGFGLALANDRLFVKVADSNLGVGDKAPVVAYLPPFAGIQSHEERTRGAIRRRRIGEGLAGAVLRNLLLDMQQVNAEKRLALRGSKTKIADSDLRRLRNEDPWELLQQALREVFGAEVVLDEFSEEYHTYIRAKVTKGKVEGYKLTRHHGYNSRDLMVEGSGFLQWLSVFTLATSPETNVLLFDEPDAHLHPTLQTQLLVHLHRLAEANGKQVLLATHSTEILRGADASEIMQVRSGGSTKYLTEDHQKSGLLEGIGSDYAPRIDRVRRTKRVLFYEGSSDDQILRCFASTLGTTWPGRAIPWQSTATHKERRGLWRSLCDEFGDVCALSLRDRDDEPIGTVDHALVDGNINALIGFDARKWRRRHIESYLLWPAAIAAVAGKTEAEVTQYLGDKHALAIGTSFVMTDAPLALLDAHGKEILADFGVKAIDVARKIPREAICDDIKTFLGELASFAA